MLRELVRTVAIEFMRISLGKMFEAARLLRILRKLFEAATRAEWFAAADFWEIVCSLFGFCLGSVWVLFGFRLGSVWFPFGFRLVH